MKQDKQEQTNLRWNESQWIESIESLTDQSVPKEVIEPNLGWLSGLRVRTG